MALRLLQSRYTCARNSSAVNSEAMMKRRVLVAALVGTLGAGTIFAQTQPPSPQTTPRPQTSGAGAQTTDTKPATDAPRRMRSAGGDQAGHVAPKPQPPTDAP